ncbi:MAG: dynamin family protein [Oscillochloridaceae bacterium umkhey_bin13]
MTSYRSLRDAEFKLYGAIVQLRAIANSLELAETASLRDLETLVLGHRFRVAVVGEFNRGKSTAINALLGANVVPASIEACSAALNRITFGERISARVVMQGDGPPEERSEEIPLDELVAYVTKLSPDQARMAANVEEAVLTYPSRFCRNNVDLIDTPGLNDEPTMTAITLRALGRINAAIMVIRASFSFSRSEQVLLEKLLNQDVTRIIFLVTAIDELDPADQPRVVRATKSRILKALRHYADEVFEEGSDEYVQFLARFGEPQVYGVAALMALEAKLTGSLELEQASGYPAFEKALEELLAGSDGTLTVQQLARKLLKVCEQIERALDAQIDQAHQMHDLDLVEQQFATLSAQWRNEARELEQILAQQGTNLALELRHAATQHSEGLIQAVRMTLNTLLIEPRDVVAIAGGLLSDSSRQKLVAANYRTWAINLALSTPPAGPQQIASLQPVIQQALAVSWQEVIAGQIHAIFTMTQSLAGSVDQQLEDWHQQVRALLAPVHSQPALSATELWGQRKEDLAQYGIARSALVAQLGRQPPQVPMQPSLVALRAFVTTIESVRGQSHFDTTAFLTNFRELCDRAVYAGIMTGHEQRLGQLETLAAHATEIAASIAAVPRSALRVLIEHTQQELAALQLRRQRQAETQQLVVRQRLEQFASQVAFLRQTTNQILSDLEDNRQVVVQKT